MFLMAFGVQEMAVGWIQVAKQCQDKFSRVLIFAVWGSFANIAKKFVHCENKYVYGITSSLHHRYTAISLHHICRY